MLPFTLLAIVINIDPNLLMLGPLTLSWHGLFSAIGVIVGVTLGVRTAVEGGADEDGAYNLALWGVAGGIVGARLFHVVDASNWDYYSRDPIRILMINEGGIAIYGAIVGGVATGFVYARLKKIKVAAVADGAAIGLTIGQAIGRIGDVINGEHHGLPLDAPWAVVYTHPNTLGEIGKAVHLAVGYEMAWDVLLLGLLLLMRRQWIGRGVMFWTYILLYSLGRFWISFYRVDQIVALDLRQAQLIAVAGVVLSVLVLAKMLLIDRIRPSTEQPYHDEDGAADEELEADEAGRPA